MGNNDMCIATAPRGFLLCLFSMFRHPKIASYGTLNVVNCCYIFPFINILCTFLAGIYHCFL